MPDDSDPKHSASAASIALVVGGTVIGNEKATVSVVGRARDAEEGMLCFAQSIDFLEGRDPTAIGAVLLCTAEIGRNLSGTRIIVDNPRLAFATAVREFFAEPNFAGIAASAHIDPRAKISARVAIGHNSVIGPEVSIGEDTQIGHNVVISHGVQIGARCHIGSNTVIGEPGFGFGKDNEGRRARIPHLGSVVIGDGVEIGALSSIAAGTIDVTRIGDGVKIDDHVFIAHNVVLEENVAVIACAEISGSVRIGRNTWIGPNVSIRDGVSVAAHSLVGIGSTVVKNLDEPGVYAGLPARFIRPMNTNDQQR